MRGAATSTQPARCRPQECMTQLTPTVEPVAAPPAQPITAAPVAASRERLPAIDQLRGLVMMVMALDHTRDFFSNVAFDPLDLTRTDPALFFTRWVTHFCAPVFVLLAGAGAFLYGARGRSRGAVARYLLLRGLLLVVLELTVVNFAWNFDNRPGFVLAQVIWALGWSMVALAGLVALRLPTGVIGALGLAMIALHNLFDGPNVLQRL